MAKRSGGFGSGRAIQSRGRESGSPASAGTRGQRMRPPAHGAAAQVQLVSHRLARPQQAARGWAGWRLLASSQEQEQAQEQAHKHELVLLRVPWSDCGRGGGERSPETLHSGREGKARQIGGTQRHTQACYPTKQVTSRTGSAHCGRTHLPGTPRAGLIGNRRGSPWPSVTATVVIRPRATRLLQIAALQGPVIA